MNMSRDTATSALRRDIQPSDDRIKCFMQLLAVLCGKPQDTSASGGKRHAQKLDRRSVGDRADREPDDIRSRDQEQHLLLGRDPREAQGGQVGAG